jgi:hypothetical protein
MAPWSGGAAYALAALSQIPALNKHHDFLALICMKLVPSGFRIG